MISKRYFIAICVLILGFLFIPLFYLAFHVFPATDDFGFASALRDSNIWSISKDIYLTMDNRLCGNFITLLFCNCNNLILHRFQLVFFIILLFGSFYLVLLKVNKLYVGSSKSEVLILFSLFSFLYIGFNPGVNEAFFWFPGVAVWSSSLIVLNILIYSTLKYLTTQKYNSIYFIIISISLFVLTSQNEIMFLLMFLCSLFLCYSYFSTYGKSYRLQITILLIVLAVGSAIVVFGPGNYVRLKFISEKQPVSFINILISNVILYRKIFFLSDILFINMVLLPYYYHLTRRISEYINPRKLLLLSVLLLFVFILPSLIAKTSYSFRIQNVVFYLSLILVFVNFINLSLYLRLKKYVLLNYSNKYLLIVLVFFLLFYSLKKESVVRTMYSDIFSKNIYNYSIEMLEREKTILDCKNDTVYVKPIQFKPKSVFIDDITEDNEDWRNSVYNNYYQKIIILK